MPAGSGIKPLSRLFRRPAEGAKDLILGIGSDEPPMGVVQP